MDLIDRQAAIDALCSECQGRCVPCDNYPCGEVKALSDLPSAEPERKTSRWGYMLIDGSIMCLNCGTRYDWDSQAQYYKHCPNCGSRMMEVNQDE